MKENENVINNVIQYLNLLVTTINPGINIAIPKCHPCQKLCDEIDDDLQDYIELITTSYTL